MGNLIHFEPERSSHVRRLSYDPDTKDLHVMFTNDASYTHGNVPPNVFAAMTRHPSIGTYYHKVIKRHYPMTVKSPKG